MIIPPELGTGTNIFATDPHRIAGSRAERPLLEYPVLEKFDWLFFDDRPGVSRQLWDILLTLIEIVPVYKWVSWVGVGERPRL